MPSQRPVGLPLVSVRHVGISTQNPCRLDIVNFVHEAHERRAQKCTLRKYLLDCSICALENSSTASVTLLELCSGERTKSSS